MFKIIMEIYLINLVYFENIINYFKNQIINNIYYVFIKIY